MIDVFFRGDPGAFGGRDDRTTVPRRAQLVPDRQHIAMDSAFRRGIGAELENVHRGQGLGVRG